jgi:hypothetical protein
MLKPVAAVALATALLLTACGRQPSVQERAMAAYKAGDYATALPLLKQWAADPSVRVDGKPPKEVMAYIVDAELKVKGPQPLPSAVATPSAPRLPDDASLTKLPPIPGTSAPDLQAQAMAVGAAQSGADIATGADRIPHKPLKAGEVLDTSIKGLANFEYDASAGGPIPADVMALNGAHVRLKGFMIPMTQAEDITDFALVPSLVSCCFGQPPGVQHVFTCRMPKGRAVQYSVDEISVEGTLKINIQRDQNYTSSIFELDVSSVKTVE